MWVVKLGGSLAAGGMLPLWLAVLAEDGRGRAVIVPGGGAFADGVRAMQVSHGFPDVVAHRMALLAMEQYGLLLHGLRPELVPASTWEEIHAALARGQTPVWMASTLALAAPEIAPSWDVTSDSLAAWLAARLEASHLVLVKSTRLNRAEVSAVELCRAGVVDTAFPSLLARHPCTTLLLDPLETALLREILRGRSAGVLVRAA